MAECQFCGDDDALEREHVWPNWVLKFIRKLDGADRHRIWGFREDGEQLFWSEEKPELVRRIVCHSCNHDRLGAMEDKMAPVLKPLIAGRHRILSKSDLPSIALWSVKTAMVAEFVATKDRIQLYSFAERRALALDRRIPDGVAVFVAHFIHPIPKLFLAGRDLEFGTDRFYAATIAIGELIVQVFASRPGSGVTEQIAAQPPHGVKQIWPARTNLLWPSHVHFEHEGLLALATLGIGDPLPTHPPKR